MRRIAAMTGVTAMALSAGCEWLVTTPSLYGTVTVDVQQRNGAPVAGATLILYTGTRPMGYAETNAGGSHVFHDVPAGAYGVRVVAPLGYVRLEDLAGGPPSDVNDKLEIGTSLSAAAHFTLLKDGLGTVVAEVTQPDGTPVAQVPLTLYSATGPLRSAMTDGAGRFVFDSIPLGGYGVRIVPGAAYTDSGEPGIVVHDGIFVDEGSREVIRFQVAQCMGTLAVTVRDETGTGVPGSVLSVYSPSEVVLEARTGADGLYAFRNVSCGSYGVRVRPPVGWSVVDGRGTSFNDGLIVHRGTVTSTTLTAQVVSARATLRVRVMDETGAPVAGAHITLYTFDGTYRDVLTATDGQVLLDGIPTDRQYGVRVDPPSGYTVTAGRGSSFVDGLTFTDGQLLDVAFRVAHR